MPAWSVPRQEFNVLFDQPSDFRKASRRGRRPGQPQPQAWSRRARRDIFRRRQNGERWETIYPVWNNWNFNACEAHLLKRTTLIEHGLPYSSNSRYVNSECGKVDFAECLIGDEKAVLPGKSQAVFQPADFAEDTDMA